MAAQAACGRALLLKPGDPTVLSNAALFHVQTGDLDGAEALLMQASPSSAEFPRITSNLALVRSLKNSRPPQAPSVVPAKERTLVPSPTRLEAPSAPDKPVATLPMPSNASDIAMVPQSASVTETPADGFGAPAPTASALDRLQMGPSGRVQPLPPQPPAAVAKSKPTGIQSGLRSGALLQMRPTPDDDKPSAIPPKKAATEKTASAGALDK